MKFNFSIFALIILSITFYSCKEDIKEIKPTPAKKEIIKPLFLNLSPQMSQKTFDSTITKLTQQGKLIDRNFVISLDDKELEFKISKRINSIQLGCNETRSTSNTMNKNEKYKKYKKYNNYYDEIALKIDKLFQTKYLEIDVPKLSDISGEKQKMYKDDNKIIEVYYRKISCPNPLKKIHLGDRLNDDEVGESKIGEMYARMDAEKPLLFGLDIYINYYNQKDGEMRKNTLWRKYNIEQQEIKNYEKIKHMKESNIQNL